MHVSRQNTLQTLKINQLEDDLKDYKDIKDYSKTNTEGQIVDRINLIQDTNNHSKEIDQGQINQNDSFVFSEIVINQEIKSSSHQKEI